MKKFFWMGISWKFGEEHDLMDECLHQHMQNQRNQLYFVKCRNNRIGKIVFFFEHDSIPKLLLHIYEKIHQNFHWIEVRQMDLFEVCSTCQIEEKLLYFKVGGIEYITKEPNSYGRACW